jgi:hypothetical protein
MSEELETAHNNLCLEVQRLTNEFAQMRLALTFLVQRVERCEEELRLRRLNRRQAWTTTEPPVFYDETGALGDSEPE